VFGEGEVYQYPQNLIGKEPQKKPEDKSNLPVHAAGDDYRNL
jgi:hypothetical protein